MPKLSNSEKVKLTKAVSNALPSSALTSVENLQKIADFVESIKK